MEDPEALQSPSSESLSSQSIISRHVFDISLQVQVLQQQVALLQEQQQSQAADISALGARLSWLERLVQAVRRCFAGR